MSTQLSNKAAYADGWAPVGDFECARIFGDLRGSMPASIADGSTQADTIRSCLNLLERALRGETRAQKVYRGTLKFKGERFYCTRKPRLRA